MSIDTTPWLVSDLHRELVRLAETGGLEDPSIVEASTLVSLLPNGDPTSECDRLISGWQIRQHGDLLRAALLSRRAGMPLSERLDATKFHVADKGIDESFVRERLLMQMAWCIYDQQSRVRPEREPPGAPKDIGGPNVIVCGYTAVGKTTHALLLAQQLGYDYVSASTALVERLHSSRDAPWRTRRRVLGTQRSLGADLEVDRTLAHWARTRSSVVFDSWALPLFSVDRPQAVVWLEAPVSDRGRKCRCSQLFSPNPLSVAECRDLVARIDSEANARFDGMYNVDYGDTPDRADIVLPASGYLDDATTNSAIRGIRRFHPVVKDAVVELLSRL
jgi:cytidylate kinase